MKKLLFVCLIVLVLSGCEEGLTGNDSGMEGEEFSFSDMYSKIKTLQEEIDRLKAASTVGAVNELVLRMDNLESTVDGHGTSINSLNTTFYGVARLSDPYTGQPTIQFSGVNVQIVSGSGSTAGGINGRGNLIVGYNETRAGNSDKSGSHNIIVGLQHNYSSYGGLVAGLRNTISARYSCVNGGRDNTATGDGSSVSGGIYNSASGDESSVSGGWLNTADGKYSSVSGGWQNRASGMNSSVSGGIYNIAGNTYASVSGGCWNEASARYSSVSGGTNNTAGGERSSVSGGSHNTANGERSSVSGGYQRSVANRYNWTAGGLFQAQ
ncbi:MAG: hypothetical protein GY754_03685 [bacterium]|nr:hypothetical protein [bacterium]